MKKTLSKLKKKRQYVKVYLSDENHSEITHFNGIILDYNKEFILMLDFYDFFMDGYVVLRRKDVNEIKRTKTEKFFQKILEKENILDSFMEKCDPITLDSLKNMFKTLKEKKLPVIIERKYDEDIFQIGSVYSVEKKKVLLNYFNSNGKYDFKPVASHFKAITFIRFGDRYSKLFYKYATNVK